MWSRQSLVRTDGVLVDIGPTDATGVEPAAAAFGSSGSGVVAGNLR
jgi:hypothetical protein